jgi:hypothetical protein
LLILFRTYTIYLMIRINFPSKTEIFFHIPNDFDFPLSIHKFFVVLFHLHFLFSQSHHSVRVLLHFHSHQIYHPFSSKVPFQWRTLNLLLHLVVIFDSSSLLFFLLLLLLYC